MSTKRPSYNEKINSLCLYFNISKNAARYIFHRRRRGHPWKKENDSKYLEWSIPIQNAFIKADNLGSINWDSVSFECDIKLLQDNGINIDNNLQSIYRNENYCKNIKEEEDKDDGWTVVTAKKSNLMQKQILKKMGFYIVKNSNQKMNKNKSNKN